MNSMKNLSAEATVSPIQFSHALPAPETSTEGTLSLASTKTIRVAWASFTQGAGLEEPELDCPAGRSLPKRGDEVMESFDLMREQLRHRSQTKTIAMEERLQRSEWSQRRFWGINE